MSEFATAIDRAKAELAANPRLRLGIWIIVAILAGYFSFVVQAERVEAAATGFATADKRLTQGRDLLARQDWAERLAAARATEAELVASFWRAPNEGLAQARMRTVVDDLLVELHFARPRAELGMSRPVADVPGLLKVQGRIFGRAGSPAGLRLLHRIASHPNKLVVERLELTRDGSSMRVDLLLSGYFLLDGHGAGGPGADTRTP